MNAVLSPALHDVRLVSHLTFVHARVAELADAGGLNPPPRKGVRVRSPPRAHPDRVSRTFDRIVADVGLPRIRLHDLRHSYASLALKAGVHPKIVSERLGRSTIAITLDLYSHVALGLDADAAKLIASRIYGTNR